MNLFRHMLRIEYVEGSGSIEEALVQYLEKLDAESPNRRQEWIRSALRNAFVQQQYILMSGQTDKEGRGV